LYIDYLVSNTTDLPFSFNCQSWGFILAERITSHSEKLLDLSVELNNICSNIALVVVFSRKKFEHNEKLGSDKNIKTVEENKIEHLCQSPILLF
jgi:hypothetical protein